MTELKTEQESLVFVKRMVAVAVSSITYLRGIFPESAYRSRYLEGEEGAVSVAVSHIMSLTRDVYLFFGYSLFLISLDLCVKVLREDSHASGASKVVKW